MSRTSDNQMRFNLGIVDVKTYVNFMRTETDIASGERNEAGMHVLVFFENSDVPVPIFPFDG